MRALLGLVLGYAVGAGLGFLLVYAVSSNSYDKSQEAVVTALLILGPLGAVIGLIAGLVSWLRHRKARLPNT